MLARYRSRMLVTRFLLAAAIIATPAQAAVDMTGPWYVAFAALGIIVETRFDFVQAGTSLSGNGYSGTIDPDTGVFELSQTKFCSVLGNPNPVPVTATISGTVAPDGQSFTGTAVDHVQAGQGCFTVNAETLGLRIPPECGDGDLDPGETCDPEVSSQCCTLYCTAKTGMLCTNDGNPCTSDVCDGAGSCSHPAGNAGATCRPAVDECDAAEICDGASDACPADSVAGASVVCRPAAGPCDVAENCDGSGVACPADEKSTEVCRPSAGACDVAESCDGASNACPADGFASSATVCRPSVGPCDVAETCTDSGPSCPADTVLPDTDSDTVCDPTDNCDDVANPWQDDNDGDLLGDACDPCTNLVPTIQSKAKLTLTKLLAPANDDKVTFSSTFSAVPASPVIDPVTKGARFLITDSTGAIPVDITIPPGAYSNANKAGWKVNRSGTSWTYKNAGSLVSLVNGITTVQIKRLATPGQLKTKVKGKNGSYALDTANLPLTATLVIDPPFASTGQCGEAAFGVPPAQPSCLAVRGGTTVKCK